MTVKPVNATDHMALHMMVKPVAEWEHQSLAVGQRHTVAAQGVSNALRTNSQTMSTQ